MATALSSVRAGASRVSSSILGLTATTSSPAAAAAAGSLKPSHGLRGKKLINEMHRRLYPQLYKDDGKPKSPLKGSHHTRLRHKAAEKSREAMKKGWYRQKLRMNNKSLPTPQQRYSIKKACPDPVSAVTASQIALLDPKGQRTRLFSKANPECARVGDVLLVRQRTGEPFAGVCLNIRRRGIDTAILLRGQLTRVGVEVWYKVYSPLVEGIEVVQRAQKRARRARLTYMRKPKHDRGSVENIVRVYLRQKAALGTADSKKSAAAAKVAAGGKKGNSRNKRGKKR